MFQYICKEAVAIPGKKQAGTDLKNLKLRLSFPPYNMPNERERGA